MVLWLCGRPLSLSQEQKFRRKKAILVLLAVTLIFFAAWAPLNIFMLLFEYYPKILKEALGNPNHNIIFGLMLLLGGTNSIANPILYGYMNENFKKEYKNFYGKIFWIPKFRTMKNVGSRFLRLAFYKKSSTSQNDEILVMNEMRNAPPKLLKHFSDSTMLMKLPPYQLHDVQKCKYILISLFEKRILWCS